MILYPSVEVCSEGKRKIIHSFIVYPFIRSGAKNKFYQPTLFFSIILTHVIFCFYGSTELELLEKLMNKFIENKSAFFHS